MTGANSTTKQQAKSNAHLLNSQKAGLPRWPYASLRHPSGMGLQLPTAIKGNATSENKALHLLRAQLGLARKSDSWSKRQQLDPCEDNVRVGLPVRGAQRKGLLSV